MKNCRPIFIVLLILAIGAGVAFAAKQELPKDLKGTKFFVFAPDGKKQQSFSANRTAVNMTEDMQYAIQNPTSSCKFRLQSTATRVGALRHLPKPVDYQRGVNSNTPFLNVSACTGGTGEFN